MKKIKLLFLSTAIVIASGCALLDKATPAPEPQDVIKEMITNMQDVKSSAVEITSKVYKEDKEVKTTVDADLKLTAKMEEVADNMPNLEFDVELALKTNDPDKGAMNGNVKLISKIVDATLYFQLKELNLPPELQEQVASFVDSYKGNWYKLPDELMPPDVKEQFKESYTDEAKQAQIYVLIKEAQLFDVLESSEASGQFVYKVQINQESLKNLSKEMAKLEGEVITETDLAMIDDFFTQYTHALTLYINQDSRYLDQVDFTLNAKDPAEKLNVSFSIKSKDVNKAQNIAKPDDAQDFNPLSLMGLGMMLEGSQGTNLGEGADINMEDLDMGELEGMNMEELEESMKMLETDMQDFETQINSATE